MIKSLVSVVLSILLAGCAARSAGDAPRETGAHAAPSRTLRFADAVPVDRLHAGADECEIDLFLRVRLANRDLFFGQIDHYAAGDDEQVSRTRAIAASRTRDGWLALEFDDDRLRNAEWQFVASGPAEAEAWGVLEEHLTHAVPTILIAHTTDAGATWSLVALEKPAKRAEYVAFAMDAKGRGRLTLQLSSDPHSDRDGFYHLRTTDAGRTWSTPQFERDGLSPAEEVPAEDDPINGDRPGTFEASAPSRRSTGESAAGASANLLP